MSGLSPRQSVIMRRPVYTHWSFAFLVIAISVVGLAKARADERPPRVVVMETDTPDCVGLMEARGDGPITIVNNCDAPLVLGNVHVAYRDNMFLPVEDGMFTLEPGQEAQAVSAGDQYLTWSLPDGRMGVIGLAYEGVDSSHGCNGCDLSNAWGSAPLLGWVLLALMVIGRRRIHSLEQQECNSNF